MRYLWVVFLFVGCSNHNNNSIDIAQYRSIQLKDSFSMPSKDEFKSKKNMRVIVLEIKQQENKEVNIGYALAKELTSRLVALRTIQVLERFKKTDVIKEQRYYEAVQEDEADFENADYRIQGDITRINQQVRPHKGWHSIETCVAGAIKLFKLPSKQIQEAFPFEECVYERKNRPQPRDISKNNYSKLLTKVVPEIIDSLMPKMAKAFKPEGYIYAMRINRDKKIIKTSLNRSLGAIEGRKIEIVKIEKEKNLSGGEDIIEIPIGTGKVSDIITDSYSFITIDELREEVHRGDIVRIK
jgi:hypothetical protein